MDAGQLYAQVRASILAVATGLSDDQLATHVPACPGWTVLDLLAHLSGLTADVLAGRVDGAGSDAWTGRQVEERRERALADVLAEWEEHAGPFLDLVTAIGAGATRIVADITIHRDDLREALGLPADVDDEAADTVFQGCIAAAGGRLDEAGVPALRLRAGTSEWTVGSGEPAATVAAPAYELFRGLAGRRSLLTMAAWDWDGEAAPYLPVLPLFPPPAETANRLGDADAAHSPTAT